MIVKGRVGGLVQGVWFRRHVADAAATHGVTGYARNLADGSVEVLLVGKAEAVAAVQAQVASGPPRSRVDAVDWLVLDDGDGEGFRIL